MSTMSPRAQLADLAASAMLGTDRSGGKAGPGPLLLQACILGARARAGWKPAAGAGRAPECPAETMPTASRGAMAMLERLLAQPEQALIDEWAGLARERAVCVAAATVPALLEWWANQPVRSEAVFAVTGVRGRWLASLNEAWRRPVAGAEIPGDADEVWQTGKTPERVAVLTTVRRHDPARALEMIRATWRSDGADERRRFLAALAEGRSMADEPFLESALDDKGKLVRRQAALLLTQIPGSRLRARMTERARAIIKAKSPGGLLRRGAARIFIEVPKEFDQAWERDGIEEKPAEGGMRAWWLRQILGAADLSIWTEGTGVDRERVLGAISSDDFFEDALRGLIQAVALSGDPAWVTALTRGLIDREKSAWQSVVGLWDALARERREALTLEVAAHKRFSAQDRWMILATAEGGWSPAFSAAAMGILKKHPPRKSDNFWCLIEAAEAVSRRIAPAAAAEFEEVVTAAFPEEPAGRLQKIIDRVRLRAAMHKEFAS